MKPVKLLKPTAIKMKRKHILGILVFILTISCKAQTIIPLENEYLYYNTENGVPPNSYLKDINHLLDKFVGTWKGTYNGRRFELRIIKNTKTTTNDNITFDRLLIRYIIIDTNGTILENSTSFTNNDSPYIMRGMRFNQKGTQYCLSYVGKEVNCAQSGDVNISIGKADNNKMVLTLFPDKILVTEKDCPEFVMANHILPVEDTMFLYRQ